MGKHGKSIKSEIELNDSFPVTIFHRKRESEVINDFKSPDIKESSENLVISLRGYFLK
jgi:hypothetical protein